MSGGPGCAYLLAVPDWDSGFFPPVKCFFGSTVNKAQKSSELSRIECQDIFAVASDSPLSETFRSGEELDWAFWRWEGGRGLRERARGGAG